MYISSRSREMAAGSILPEMDFSWLGDNFFKGDVSSLLSVGQGPKNFDLANIAELYLFDDSGTAEWVE